MRRNLPVGLLLRVEQRQRRHPLPLVVPIGALCGLGIGRPGRRRRTELLPLGAQPIEVVPSDADGCLDREAGIVSDLPVRLRGSVCGYGQRCRGGQ
ncbi:hypothetical protein GA0070608_0163 [Micromonospora peucetia]|uniref:Uncharacterized protein n=1 Tax=Micromonospora peucetia TaxID=47871 RepID=A0A1C6TZ15_9ACTN|nr:hypothetical protein GA0070608_0163 [Micromonospora peucetia]